MSRSGVGAEMLVVSDTKQRITEKACEKSRHRLRFDKALCLIFAEYYNLIVMGNIYLLSMTV